MTGTRKTTEFSSAHSRQTLLSPSESLQWERVGSQMVLSVPNLNICFFLIVKFEIYVFCSLNLPQFHNVIFCNDWMNWMKNVDLHTNE